MAKIGLIAALLATTAAFTSVNAFAAPYHIFGTSNKNCNITKPRGQQNQKVDAPRTIDRYPVAGD